VVPAVGFKLFATQNPVGIYGGRKNLSRAFRNRFIEICFGDLPFEEIEDIVSRSCGIPAKFSKAMVDVMRDLQVSFAQLYVLLYSSVFAL
jgi:midasin